MALLKCRLKSSAPKYPSPRNAPTELCERRPFPNSCLPLVCHSPATAWSICISLAANLLPPLSRYSSLSLLSASAPRLDNQSDRLHQKQYLCASFRFYSIFLTSTDLFSLLILEPSSRRAFLTYRKVRHQTRIGISPGLWFQEESCALLTQTRDLDN